MMAVRIVLWQMADDRHTSRHDGQEIWVRIEIVLS